MENILQYGMRLAVLLILTVLSGFLSGSETAFFNLSYSDRKKLRETATGRRVLSLAANPNSLLNALLFGNMIINVLYFSVAGDTAISISSHLGGIAVTLFSIFSLLWLVIFGEILPKSIAFSHSLEFCLLTAIPVLISRKLLFPPTAFLNLLFIKPAVRLCLPAIPKNKKVKTEHLKSLIKNSGKNGLLMRNESELISRVVEIGRCKVRDVMRPRVDIVSCEEKTPVPKALALMAKTKIKKLPIYRGNIDNIIGFITQRDIFIKKPKTIGEILNKISFLPEQKTVESLLDFFVKTKTDIAMIVDEYGGISGLITIKDIVSNITAGSEIQQKNIELVSENLYRVSGDSSLVEWLDLIELPHFDNDYSTISGFIIAHTRKLPQVGDNFDYENLNFKVEEVKNRRIISVLVELK